MYRATTPTHTFTFPSDPSTYQTILITYRQKDVEFEVTKTDMTMLSDNKASYTLTQAQTNAFSGMGFVSVQARIKDSSGNVLASQIVKIPVNEVLDDEVL